ncbi:hypothetical protein HNY73_018900 [Argiope bruennichi]|uniref:Uncharacterized protein n=1 Tax=Argiope bruennichi TaxID=94029 RepID=A0A8T0EEF9_ARGBR|nr:hypothetical protein HNY73_018900 [Argiope bruennichi]
MMWREIDDLERKNALDCYMQGKKWMMWREIDDVERKNALDCYMQGKKWMMWRYSVFLIAKCGREMDDAVRECALDFKAQKRNEACGKRMRS